MGKVYAQGETVVLRNAKGIAVSTATVFDNVATTEASAIRVNPAGSRLIPNGYTVFVDGGFYIDGQRFELVDSDRDADGDITVWNYAIDTLVKDADAFPIKGLSIFND